MLCLLTQATVDLHCLSVISPCRILHLVKVSHEDLLVLVAQLGAPAARLAVPEHTPAGSSAQRASTQGQHSAEQHVSAWVLMLLVRVSS